MTAYRLYKAISALGYIGIGGSLTALIARGFDWWIIFQIAVMALVAIVFSIAAEVERK